MSRRWNRIGSDRVHYASIKPCPYLEPGESAERALIFTERCGLEHFRPEFAVTAGCTVDEIPDEDLRAEQVQLRDAYHAAERHYVDMVRRLPITPHPGVPASYRPQKWWLRENPEHPFTLNIRAVEASPDRVQDLGQVGTVSPG